MLCECADLQALNGSEELLYMQTTHWAVPCAAADLATSADGRSGGRNSHHPHLASSNDWALVSTSYVLVFLPAPMLQFTALQVKLYACRPAPRRPCAADGQCYHAICVRSVGRLSTMLSHARTVIRLQPKCMQQPYALAG